MFPFSCIVLSFPRIPFSEASLAVMAHFLLFMCNHCCTSGVPFPLGCCRPRLGHIRYWLDAFCWLYDVRPTLRLYFHLTALYSLTSYLISSCVWFCRLKSWRNPTVLYFLALQLLTSVVSLAYIYSSRFGLIRWRDTCWSHFSQVFEQLGL